MVDTYIKAEGVWKKIKATQNTSGDKNKKTFPQESSVFAIESMETSTSKWTPTNKKIAVIDREIGTREASEENVAATPSHQPRVHAGVVRLL
jgi:hypothetical protein